MLYFFKKLAACLANPYRSTPLVVENTFLLFKFYVSSLSVVRIATARQNRSNMNLHCVRINCKIHRRQNHVTQLNAWTIEKPNTTFADRIDGPISRVHFRFELQLTQTRAKFFVSYFWILTTILLKMNRAEWCYFHHINLNCSYAFAHFFRPEQLNISSNLKCTNGWATKV